MIDIYVKGSVSFCSKADVYVGIVNNSTKIFELA